MTLVKVVRNARRQHVVGVRAGSQHDGETNKRSGHAEGAIAVDGYSGCHRFGPRPVSIGDKAVGAAIVPCRLDAGNLAVEAIGVAYELGLCNRPTGISIIRTREILLR